MVQLSDEVFQEFIGDFGTLWRLFGSLWRALFLVYAGYWRRFKIWVTRLRNRLPTKHAVAAQARGLATYKAPGP